VLTLLLTLLLTWFSPIYPAFSFYLHHLLRSRHANQSRPKRITPETSTPNRNHQLAQVIVSPTMFGYLPHPIHNSAINANPKSAFMTIETPAIFCQSHSAICAGSGAVSSGAIQVDDQFFEHRKRHQKRSFLNPFLMRKIEAQKFQY